MAAEVRQVRVRVSPGPSSDFSHIKVRVNDVSGRMEKSLLYLL